MVNVEWKVPLVTIHHSLFTIHHVFFVSARALFCRAGASGAPPERKMRLTPRHIPFARLADLAEGRLTPEEAAEERAHLADCTTCSAQAAQLGHLSALMRADTSEDAPPELVASVVRMFRTRKTQEEQPGLLR